MKNALQPNMLTASIYTALRLQYDYFCACVQAIKEKRA